MGCLEAYPQTGQSDVDGGGWKIADKKEGSYVRVEFTSKVRASLCSLKADRHNKRVNMILNCSPTPAPVALSEVQVRRRLGDGAGQWRRPRQVRHHFISPALVCIFFFDDDERQRSGSFKKYFVQVLEPRWGLGLWRQHQARGVLRQTTEGQGVGGLKLPSLSGLNSFPSKEELPKTKELSARVAFSFLPEDLTAQLACFVSGDVIVAASWVPSSRFPLIFPLNLRAFLCDEDEWSTLMSKHV
jgi:hypothetical protein